MSPSRQFAAAPDGPALHRHMQRTASLLTEMQSNIVQLGNMLAMIQVQLDKLGPLDWLEAESLTFSRQAYWQMLAWLTPTQMPGFVKPAWPAEKSFSRHAVDVRQHAQELRDQYRILQQHGGRVAMGLSEMQTLFTQQAAPAMQWLRQYLNQQGFSSTVALLGQALEAMEAGLSAAQAQVNALCHQACDLKEQIATGVTASERHWRVVENIAQSMCEIEYNQSLLGEGQSGGEN